MGSPQQPQTTLPSAGINAPEPDRPDSDPATASGERTAQVIPGPNGPPPTVEMPAFVQAATLPADGLADTIDTNRTLASGGPWSAALLDVVDPGSYEIAGEVAQGGIGRVLRARDRRLRRPVALKQLIDCGPSAERRFVREAMITARLQHPAIVPIYEAGRFPSGEAFYSMKLVSGRSFEDVIDECEGLHQRLGLLPHVLAAAEAVAYAHSQRIIHRDLKPANILVGGFGETVVIDWGLAKDLAVEEDDETPVPEERAPPAKGAQLTLVGAVIGTPAYMPPEQAAGQPVDERADVYALGAILYHTLVGEPPYGGSTAREVLRAVLAGPPPPVSARQKDVSEDLLAIVRKAMAREPDDRYRSARELAEDLRRFETGQIVGAHRYSTLDLLRRFMRRWRAPLAVAAAALVALSIGGVVGVRRIIAERVRAEQQRAAAEAAQREALARADELTLVQARAALERDPSQALAWLQGLSPGFGRWSAARVIAADAAARGLAATLRGHEKLLNVIVFSPDGRTLVTASDDHTARLWDVATGRGRVLTGHADEVWNAAFSPDGRHVITGGKDRTVRVWDAPTGRERLQVQHGAEVFLLAFPDDQRAVFAAADGVVMEVPLSGSAPRALSSGQGVAVFSHDARTVARAANGVLTVQDMATGEERLFRKGWAGDGHGALLFSPDGRTFAHLDTAGEVRLWDVASARERLMGRIDAYALRTAWAGRRLSFSPDGSRLGAVENDTAVHVWDLRNGGVRILRGEERATRRVIFSPDGRLAATVGFEHAARIWDLETGQARALHGHEDAVMNLAFSPDGRFLATAGADHTARIFPVEVRAGRVLAGSLAGAVLAGFSPDGQLVAAGGDDGSLWIWDRDGAPTKTQAHAGPLSAAAFSPGGQHIATGGADGRVRVWSRAGAPVCAFAGVDQAAIQAVAFSPNGRLIASAGSTRATSRSSPGTRPVQRPWCSRRMARCSRRATGTARCGCGSSPRARHGCSQAMWAR
jgi:WD40 repeat protein